MRAGVSTWVVAMCLGSSAIGQETFVVNGATFVTNGDPTHILDGGDTLTVTGTGGITVNDPGASAIAGTGDANTVTVGGNIIGGPAASHGISLDGANGSVSILTGATINTQGSPSDGVLLNGADGRLSNAGTVSVSGDFSSGLRSFGAGSTVLNTGSIAINGGNTTGMSIGGAGTRVTHAAGATIIGAIGPTQRAGISSSGSNVQITQDGTITLDGANSVGVRITGAGTLLSSGGDISLDGADSVGIFVNTTGTTIRQSGDIAIDNGGPSATGVHLLQGGNTYTLAFPGAGGITMGAAGGNGIIVAGDGNILNIDSGRIIILGNDSSGIGVTGANTTITNAGEISSTGIDARGIYANADGLTVINSGLIEATLGTDGYGIFVEGGNGATVVHSGAGAAIRGSTTGDGTAIRIEGNGASVVIDEDATVTSFGISGHGVLVIGSDAHVQHLGGQIDVNGFSGVGIFVQGNNGRITTGAGSVINLLDNTTTNGSGIRFAGANGTVDTAGLILAIGDGENGIDIFGGNSTISNAGVVTVLGANGNAIEANGGGDVVTNTGRLIAQGDNGAGIQITGANTTVTNTGRITADGLGGVGIFATALTTGTTILNAGTIDVAAGGTAGISAFDDDTTVTNTGVITADGAASGILTTGDTLFVRNAGQIFGPGNDAFSATGSNVTLRLDGGSIIVGGLSFTNPATATADIGLPNAALTFNTIPATLLSDGRPQLVLGNQLFVFDPDHFAALDTLGFSAFDTLSRAHDHARASGRSGRTAWMTGAVATGEDSAGFTGLLGATLPLSPDRHIGFALGQTRNGVDAAFCATDIGATSTIGAVTYGGTLGPASFETALSFGRTASDSTRRVANNLVATGIEDATGQVDGVFYGLSATLAAPARLNGFDVRPSLRLRHAWQSTDAFSEIGASPANLSVNARTAQRTDLRVRADVELPSQDTALGDVDLSAFAGLDIARWQADGITAMAAGTPIAFETGANGVEVGGFIGGTARFELENGAQFSVGGELGQMSGTGSTLRLTAQYGITF